MQWYLTTQGGQEYAIDTVDWKYSLFQDEGTPRPAEATITVTRETPVEEKQWIVGIEDEGDVKFLGYVSRKPSISGAIQDFSCKGLEDLLWKRPCPKLTYSATDTTLNHLFASDPPWKDDTGAYWQPGLLASANGLIPPGWIATEFLVPLPTSIEPGVVYGPRFFPTYAEDIIKFRFCGKKSCFGEGDFYHDWHIFPEYSSLTELRASSDAGIYRDDTDLYVHVPTSPLPDKYSAVFGWVYGNWFCQNAFDTRVRRGTIDLATTVISDPIKVGPDSMVGDILANIAKVHEQKLRFRYDNDRYCYADLLDDFSDDGTFDVYEEECDSIDFGTDSDLHPDTLIGLGYGERLFQAAYSVFDPRPGYAHIVQTVDFQNTFEDFSGNLAPYVSVKWEELRDAKIIEITSGAYDHLIPGNTVRLHISDEPVAEYQVAAITRSATAPSVISLGKRRRDLTDSYEARQAASSTYLIDDLTELISMSANGVIGVGDWSNVDVPFLTEEPLFMPRWADIQSYNPSVILDISISNRQNCFVPTDVSALFYIEIASTNTDVALAANRIAHSETIQYMIGEPMAVNVTGSVDYNAKNYIRVHCILNGFWPTPTRTLAEITTDINTPSDGIVRDRDTYYKGIWGRILNSAHYAFLVKLEDDKYAYQIQEPGSAVPTAAWLVGDQNKVTKDLYYSHETVAGRSGATVLAEITTPSPARVRDTYIPYFWGRTKDAGTAMFVCKLDTTPAYAYQIQQPGNYKPDDPWHIGTAAQAAAALYAASNTTGPRDATAIEAEITGYSWANPNTYYWHVHGYSLVADPSAIIIQLVDSPQRFAYQITNADATKSSWMVDNADGEEIANALLIDAATTGLRSQSDINTDIGNLVFAEPETYSWQAYGYDQFASPSFTVIQVSNVPQVLAYRRKWVDDEEGDWAIDLTSGAGIVTQIAPPIRYYDCSVNASVVRRRLNP